MNFLASSGLCRVQMFQISGTNQPVQGRSLLAVSFAILLLAILGKLSDSLLKYWEARTLNWRDSYQGGEE